MDATPYEPDQHSGGEIPGPALTRRVASHCAVEIGQQDLGSSNIASQQRRKNLKGQWRRSASSIAELAIERQRAGGAAFRQLPLARPVSVHRSQEKGARRSGTGSRL